MVKSLYIFFKPDDGHSSENVRIHILIYFLHYNDFQKNKIKKTKIRHLIDSIATVLNFPYKKDWNLSMKFFHRLPLMDLLQKFSNNS